LKPVHSPDGSSANLTDTLTPQLFSLRTKAPVDIPTIIGELPSRLIRRRPAYAKPHVRNSPDGPDSCEITRAITLVSSHDWHVQPFCQRPDSTPPERRFSGTPDHKPGAPRNLFDLAFPDRSRTRFSLGHWEQKLFCLTSPGTLACALYSGFLSLRILIQTTVR
jgi:hypothetical protein